jgi:alkylation response protein AidB-like acyl-CoA dehydrogenase
MDFRFDAKQSAFRDEVRAFLRDEMPGDLRGRGFSRSFSKKVAAKGWVGLGWSSAPGIRPGGPLDRLILTEEFVLAEAPTSFHFLAERQVGPSLDRHGTDFQRSEFLPRILHADVSFCVGLSEPGAGSDLASARTTAYRKGDEYVVNGQKVWTSFAHLADKMWLLARTDPDAPKHRGLSVFLVDMASPGITVRPLPNIAGEHGFNEVFFEDVHVPANRRVGDENRGWYLVAEHLDLERSGIERIATAQPVLASLETVLRAGEWPVSESLRLRLASLEIELAVGRLLAYRVAWGMESGLVLNQEASMSKVFGSEWTQRAMNFALTVASRLDYSHPEVPELMERIQRGYLNSVANTIGGGTSEVQRGIIAARGLSLPRS